MLEIDGQAVTNRQQSGKGRSQKAQKLVEPDTAGRGGGGRARVLGRWAGAQDKKGWLKAG